MPSLRCLYSLIKVYGKLVSIFNKLRVSATAKANKTLRQRLLVLNLQGSNSCSHSISHISSDPHIISFLKFEIMSMISTSNLAHVYANIYAIIQNGAILTLLEKILEIIFSALYHFPNWCPHLFLCLSFYSVFFYFVSSRKKKK